MIGHLYPSLKPSWRLNEHDQGLECCLGKLEGQALQMYLAMKSPPCLQTS